ncbi:hypothetical protein AB0E73_32335, partial [Streptomyces sp. NPDC031705]
MAKSRTKAWSAVAAVTGAALALATAPGRTAEAVAAPGPAPEAAVTLLVGHAVEGGGGADAATWCAAGAFRGGRCGTWQQPLEVATARGGSVLWDPALGEAGELPPDAGAPLEIALARPEAGRLTDVTVT